MVAKILVESASFFRCSAATCRLCSFYSRKRLRVRPLTHDEDDEQAGQQGEGLVVASLAVDGPAELSGQVRAGDVLVSIDRVDVRGMSAEDLAQYILGPPGRYICTKPTVLFPR